MSNSTRLPTATAWFVTVAATLTMAVSYIDRQTLSAIAPTVQHVFTITDPQYGWLQAAFSCAYLVGTPLAGRWLDRISARRGLLGAMLAWTTVAAAHAIAPTFAVLVMLRLLLGLTESPGFPAAVQTIHRVLPPAQRSAGIGLLFTGSSIGAAIAPVLAITLLASGSVRTVFLGTAAAGLVWVPIWLAATTPHAVRGVLDRPPERQTGPSLPFAKLARDPAVVRAMVAVLASAPLVAFVLLWFGKFLFAQHHVSQMGLARYLWLPPLCFDIGSLGFGVLATQGHSRRVLFGIAVLFAMTAMALPWMPTPWSASLLGAVAGAGGGAIFALLTSELLTQVHGRDVATAGGLCAAAQSLAYMIANPLIGVMVHRTHAYTLALVTVGAWVIPGCALWLAWQPRSKVERATAS